ncbi:MAG TPA: DeoR/GlpR family DNA-binding transcription regulator [Actinocrinis sp.]|jgi:DeoR/GlpR family transcriptional regulator of sugar metabolism|uniref:DeoR/GlpR family DNA-binding transcription regulator n=1 Tax=Actinocrinis sp. TaxID=1920516 RepID=UPI002DDD3CC5|nr:DeoR/GlpR family DNA-binding transcription regulator [Actinocrinis sp.]HEV3172490.1 DeoR/GlpR family DNA-binding transcription regulator [Actinocrinis sp.]
MGGGRAPTKLRHEFIRAELARSGGVRIRDLAHRFGVSRATVRRDLCALIDAGDAVNVHGGALLPGDRAFGQRKPEREAIAASAARTVTQHESVGLFGGQVIQALAHRLSHRADLRIVTNSLAVAQAVDGAHERREPEVVLLSGVLSPSGTVYGSPAAASLRGLRLDASYFDCVGLDPLTGATVDDLGEAELRKTSIQLSRRNVLLVEPARLGTRGLRSFGALTDFCEVINH